MSAFADAVRDVEHEVGCGMRDDATAPCDCTTRDARIATRIEALVREMECEDACPECTAAALAAFVGASRG